MYSRLKFKRNQRKRYAENSVWSILNRLEAFLLAKASCKINEAFEKLLGK